MHRRFFPAFIALATLFQGCYAGKTFKVKERKLNCSVDYFDSLGGLPLHVSRGGRGDGNFLYTPPWKNVAAVDGTYELETGDFWSRTTMENNELEYEHSSGFGTLWLDGDFDIQYESTLKYVDQSIEEYQVREQRLGCEYFKDLVSPREYSRTEEGVLESDGYHYTKWYWVGEAVEVTGTIAYDRTYTETTNHTGPNTQIVAEESGTLFGDYYRYFEQTIFGATSLGAVEGSANGWHYDFNHSSSGPVKHWIYDLDHYGNGQGTVTGNSECAFSVSEWDCSYTSGCSGVCDLPIGKQRFYR